MESHVKPKKVCRCCVGVAAPLAAATAECSFGVPRAPGLATCAGRATSSRSKRSSTSKWLSAARWWSLPSTAHPPDARPAASTGVGGAECPTGVVLAPNSTKLPENFAKAAAGAASPPPDVRPARPAPPPAGFAVASAEGVVADVTPDGVDGLGDFSFWSMCDCCLRALPSLHTPCTRDIVSERAGGRV